MSDCNQPATERTAEDWYADWMILGEAYLQGNDSTNEGFVKLVVEHYQQIMSASYAKGRRDGMEEAVRLVQAIEADWRQFDYIAKADASDYLAEAIRAAIDKEGK